MKTKMLSSKLLHCFGSEKGEKVTPRMAAEMIQASGITEIPINTHNIDYVKDWKDLNMGYGEASWNSVSEHIDLSGCSPLWNINLPQSADEAVSRAEKVVKLGGDAPIKFEVLDTTLTWSQNGEVLKAVDYLINTNHFEVWPLIAPDYKAFIKLQSWNCGIIRIMGSPISSNRGILESNIGVIKHILNDKACSVMLDGGVNSIETILKAFDLGFDAVLVNSWIFSNENDPVSMLKEIRKVIVD